MQNKLRLEDIEITPVSNILEMMEIRKIRNSLRAFLTNDTREISILRQLFFYARYLISPRDHITIYSVKLFGEVIGYGLINQGPEGWRQTRLLTGCIHEKFQGMGIGERLFRFLIKQIDRKKHRVCLDVLATNTNAVRLYGKLGFVKFNQREFISYYRLPYGKDLHHRTSVHQ